MNALSAQIDPTNTRVDLNKFQRVSHPQTS
jgi:hypothetical protein